MAKVQKKSALFLDRDGVINEDIGHLHKIADVEFVNGIFDLCLAAKAEGLAIIVITNQAGIGRGLYTEADFHALTKWLDAEFAKKSIEIGGTYFCPYHPIHGIGQYKKASHRRKPAPGMLLDASREHTIDLATSLFVGDKQTDMEAGRAAGIGKNILYAPEGVSREPGHQDLAVSKLADIVPVLRDFCRASS